MNLGQTSAQTVKGGYLTLDPVRAAGRRGRPGHRGGRHDHRERPAERLSGNSGATTSSGGGRGRRPVRAGTGTTGCTAGAGENHVLRRGRGRLVDFTLNAVGVNFTTGGGNDEVAAVAFDDKIGRVGRERRL